MSISFRCPICREEVTSTPEHGGEFLNCPGCSKRIPIPKKQRTGKKGPATNYPETPGELRSVLIVVALVGVTWFGGRWLSDRVRKNIRYVPESNAPVKADIAKFKPNLPDLPKHASAEQITSTFKSRVYLVRCDFAEARSKQGRLGPFVERSEQTVSGSAVLIAHDLKHGLIVTNRHVIDPEFLASGIRASNVRVQVRNSKDTTFIAARIVAINKNHDLALLLVDGEWDAVEAIPVIKQQSINQGESAVSLGNPLARIIKEFGNL